MLLTVLEILMYMIVAAVLGALLGWVLRGAMGGEQAEVSDLRAQLRNLKKQLRDKEATPSIAEKAAAPASVSTSVAPKAGIAKQTKAPAAKKKATAKKAANKPKVNKPKVASKAAPKAKVKTKTTAKAAPKAKVVSTKATNTKAVKTSKKKVAVKQLSKAERNTAQLAAKKEVSGIVSRIGKDSAKDDLTLIHGVGPKYAGQLNKLGITSHAQVSKLRKAEIRTLSSAIGVFSDRIERDDWVAGAKKLLKARK